MPSIDTATATNTMGCVFLPTMTPMSATMIMYVAVTKPERLDAAAPSG